MKPTCRNIFGWIILFGVLSGCKSLSDTTVTYLGGSNELGELVTPPGFTISPKEAENIRVLKNGANIAVHDIYYDDDCYFICDGFFGSKARNAKAFGIKIDGQTGEIYNRETNEWDPRPKSNPIQ